MKVLLLYPEFPDTFWSFKHALKFIHKSAAVPPLGLLTVAAMLPADWDKRLVDVNVRKLREQDLAWADVMFISGMSWPRMSTMNTPNWPPSTSHADSIPHSPTKWPGN
jgi:hypothetical protein